MGCIINYELIQRRSNEIFDEYFKEEATNYTLFLYILQNASVTREDFFALENAYITLAKGASEYAYKFGLTENLPCCNLKLCERECPHFDHVDNENTAYIAHKRP